jgi:DNA repair photolyase
MLYNSIEYQKGRGAQINTINRHLKNNVEAVIENVYDTQVIENEEIIIGNKTEFFVDQPKTILNKVKAADLPMMFSINPYQGCEHGCTYCYARNVHENWGFSAGTDFEQKIIVKPTAPKLLEQLFMKKTWQPAVISLSGNTDCYQPAERKYQITRQMLNIFCKYRNPVGIITKNALILRDLDYLKELAENNLVQVYISITTLNETLRAKMEPRTVTSKQRLLTIEKLAKANIPIAVMAAPIIPGLTDHEIPKILEAASNAGALGAGYTVVRLNGAVGDIFTDWIQKNYLDRAQKVLNQIAECHGGKLSDSRIGVRMKGEGPIAENIKNLFKIAQKKYFEGKILPSLSLMHFRKEGMQYSLGF